MTHWQPSAPIEHLKSRAIIIQSIRDFFAKRNVLEVETPLMCHTSVTDPYIESIPAIFRTPTSSQEYYLQTSPEYAMKRLLAAGSGPIYQICKAFRQGEVGQHHNPEFTMLEWYRPGFDHHQLMNEMDELLQTVIKTKPAAKKTYGELFETYLNINPHTATVAELKIIADKHNISVNGEISDNTTWLQLLMSDLIEPQIGLDKPCFVYDFPAAQAALARINAGNPPTAARFEVYFQQLELANGFYELADEKEQRKRFENNNIKRRELNLPEIKLDEYFLQALSAGLPDCAGVALGVDRLVMMALKQKQIQSVLGFDFLRA